eukprot:556803_1
MHPHWFLMTTIMPVCFTVCVILTILQRKSLRRAPITSVEENEMFSPKTERFCLYGQYIIGGLCAMQCFLCHISNFFPEFYCVYGMAICLIIYAATKSCLYGFFLERSKCVQTHFHSILPKAVWLYVFPSYVAIYFMVWLVLCSWAFRGKVVDPIADPTMPTACLFGEFHPGVFTFSAFVDVFNSIFFLVLFMLPICELMSQSSNGNRSDEARIGRHLQETEVQKQAKQKVKKDFLTLLKYNVICSTICSVSSVAFLFAMAFADRGSVGHYLWFFGNIDIMINSISLFMMLGSNRRYMRYLWSEWIAIELKSMKKEATVFISNCCSHSEDAPNNKPVLVSTKTNGCSNKSASGSATGNTCTSTTTDFGHIHNDNVV